MNLFDFFSRKKISSYNPQSSTDPVTPTPTSIPVSTSGQTAHPFGNNGSTSDEKEPPTLFPKKINQSGSNKHQVHNFVILDESGSMDTIKYSIIKGFNEIVQNAQDIEKDFPDQEHFFTILSFNSDKMQYIHYAEPVQNIQAINSQKYRPTACTPLLDATGLGLLHFEKHLKSVLQNTSYDVLVSIMTDGDENSSTQMTYEEVRKIISRLQEEGWTFTFIGTEQDVEKNAADLNITNTMNFQRDETDIQRMFEEEKNARRRFSEKISRNEYRKNNFYEEKS